VSIMPKVIYDKLNHNSLVSTSMHLQLADQLIWHPVGITEDILVKIRNSFMLVDFVVLEMDVCRQAPLILGRPFLSTAGVTIDIAARIIQLNISGKEEIFTFKTKGVGQCNQLSVLAGPKKNAKSSRKKPDTTNYSMDKFLWRVKNATPTAPKSPVTPAN
jgi:hypothetical protein